MVTRRCYWKHSSMVPDSKELAIAPPTGLLWEKPPGEEEWIVTTKRSGPKNGSSSFRCIAASNSDSVPSIRPVSRLRLTNAVNKYLCLSTQILTFLRVHAGEDRTRTLDVLLTDQ